MSARHLQSLKALAARSSAVYNAVKMATRLSPVPDSEPQSTRSIDSPADSLVETGAPRVTLRNSFAHPFDSAMAAARTCYSPHLVQPEEITEKQRVMIGSGTYFGGHHTVYQHAHFEFGLENVSRQFVWSFLHAHPFYNSEQQSQRYVRLDRAQAYVPAESAPFGAAERAIYEKAIARAWEHYRELTRVLEPTAREILGDIWHVTPDVARKARAKSGAAIGEARDRSGAVRPAGGGVHHDGAHAFGDRAAPAVADERGERHADGSAAGDRRDGGAGARSRSAIFRPLRQRADGSAAGIRERGAGRRRGVRARIRCAAGRDDVAADRFFAARDCVDGRGLSRGDGADGGGMFRTRRRSTGC